MWTGLDLRELRGRAEEKPLPLKKKNFRVLLGEGFEFGERENSSRGNGLKKKKQNAKPHSCLASPAPLVRAKRGSEAATRPPGNGARCESVQDGV